MARDINFNLWFDANCESTSDHVGSGIPCNLNFVITLWHIWLMRNDKIFNNKMQKQHDQVAAKSLKYETITYEVF